MKRHPDALINRRNWQDTRLYLKYHRTILQNKIRSVESIRGAMDELLEWATDIPLTNSTDINPTLVEYLNGKEMTASYRAKLLEFIRGFYEWARDEIPDRYGSFKKSWIDSLKSKIKDTGLVEEKPIFTLSMVREITALKPRSLVEERDIAAVAFLFLSGMRDGAFCSLPIRSVDITRDPIMVRQWPQWGVRTKGDKAANTYLLPNPDLEDLREIVRAWHRKIAPIVGEKGMWFTIFDAGTGNPAANQVPGLSRSGDLGDRLKLLCARAGIEYASPHRIRHGHVVHAMSYCRSMDELKAVSQNVMHNSITTTESIYGDLPSDSIAATLMVMSQRESDPENGMRLTSSLFKRSLDRRR